MSSETDRNQSTNLMTDFDPRIVYNNNPLPNYGEAELFVGGNTDTVISRLAAFFLFIFRPKYNRRSIKGITILAPPEKTNLFSFSSIKEEIINAAKFIANRDLDDKEIRYISDKVSLIYSNSFNVNDVISALENIDDDQLVLLPLASKYKNKAVEELASGKRVMMKFYEDSWVPHLASLAKICIPIAKKANSLLILEAPEIPPARDKNIDLLHEVEDLYPVFLITTSEQGDVNDEFTNEFLENIEKWSVMALQGNLDQALVELDNSKIIDSIKQQICIQLISHSGNDSEATVLIEESLNKSVILDPSLAIRYAQIAIRTGRVEIVKILLDRYLDELILKNDLELALNISELIEEISLSQRAYSRIEMLYPDSNYLKVNRQVRLVKICGGEYSEEDSNDLLFGFRAVELFLAESLSANDVTDFSSVLAVIKTKFEEHLELAYICCALSAFKNEDYLNALNLSIMVAEDGVLERYSVNIVLRSLRKMFLLRKIHKENAGKYKMPIIYIIRYIARNPNDSEVRVNLESILSVDSCGSIGLPIIASIALELTQVGVSLKKEINQNEIDEDIENIMSFVEKAFAWMSKIPAVDVGSTRLPEVLIPSNVEGVIKKIRLLINHGTSNLEYDEDVIVNEKLAMLICLLSPHSKDGCVDDLKALRSVASHFWLQGKSQKARDYAEQILELADGSLQRKRVAWSSFADIYQRVSNPVNSLIGIASALSCDAEVDTLDLFEEMFLLTRITRDLHLHSISSKILTSCLNFCDRYDLGKQAKTRVNTIELGIKFLSVANGEDSELKSFIHDANIHCNNVIDVEDELIPSVSLLLQAIRLYESLGQCVDEETLVTLEKALNKTGASIRSYLNTIAEVNPSIENILDVYRRVEVSRYSSDIPDDLKVVTVLSRRFLQNINAEPKEALIALELLADRGIELPNNARNIESEWLSDYAKEITYDDTAVVMLGLDAKDNLRHVIIEDGNVSFHNAKIEDVNFEAIIKEWSEDYPYNYSLIDSSDGNNEFYLTLGKLQLPLPSKKNIMVIAEPLLQQIPINLALVDGEFVGRNHTIGYVPSLTWLESMHRRRYTSDNRRLAWISASEDPNDFGTLEMLHERLASVFDGYGFELNTKREIPHNFSNARMAVVTAHGGLSGEGRFIHKISDEGVLAETPKRLAQSLANVELVILFVCSGGRIDKHPFNHTTVGLPKLLLDNGCRAVVASPWPLEAKVVGPWLEEFMVLWERGETVSSATQLANEEVAKRLGDFAQYTQAMHVYGDVMCVIHRDRFNLLNSNSSL
ncbi:CHAT domain-containing protein [Shewanella algae]|uniref:CHAT domain-containing protein n=1 Tax=Shewanella algae TaxID=38313 RepID=UPI0031F4CA7F